MNTSQRRTFRNSLTEQGFARTGHTTDLDARGDYTETWSHTDGTTVTIEWAERDQEDNLDRYTVYRTEDGREALVVFEGPGGADPSTLRPLRDGVGGVRVGYLNADGSVPSMLDAEYDFYSGLLTPVRSLAPKGA